jgi:hypothetical protein
VTLLVTVFVKRLPDETRPTRRIARFPGERGKQTHRLEKAHPAISGDQFTSKRSVTNRDKIGVQLCAFSFLDDAKTHEKLANRDIFGGFNSHRLHHFYIVVGYASRCRIMLISLIFRTLRYSARSVSTFRLCPFVAGNVHSL